MRAFFVFSVACALIGCSFPETTDMELDKISAGINLFSAKFCKEVDAASSSVSSPLSVQVLLGLVALGSADKAHNEILTALSLPDDNSVRAGFSAVSSNLKKVKGVTFAMANKVYVKSGSYELKEAFRKDAVDVFGAEVEKVNFNDGAFAAKVINAWVEGKTNNKIKDLLTPDSVGPDTRLVLVNALYFKGSWKNKFDVSDTRDQPFHVDAKKTINIPFMNMERKFMYGQSEDLKAQVLEMPYEGEEASLLVVLPREVDGLAHVLQRLADGADLTAVRASLREVKVKVSLPKFKIETETDLTALLPKLGVKTIFDANSNQLPGLIDGDEPLYVSKAVQKAFIEVNEEGAEAAAATAFGIVLLSAFIEPELAKFTADRPFLAAVRVGPTFAFWAVVRDF